MQSSPLLGAGRGLAAPASTLLPAFQGEVTLYLVWAFVSACKSVFIDTLRGHSFPKEIKRKHL